MKIVRQNVGQSKAFTLAAFATEEDVVANLSLIDIFETVFTPCLGGGAGKSL